ncbi:MAG: CaiB/BaiF CoA transferase family protein [Solirubrobacteraceae bacterium]
MPEGPLSGVQVVEVASMAAGPFCARLLGDYGADVVKVEPPEGDPLRTLDADWFAGLNTNKRSVVADLDTQDGRDGVAALIARADLLVCDLSGEDLLLLEDVLDDAPAALVVVSITPFGRTGPRAGWRGGDLVAAASGGLAHITGDPDREPLVPGGRQMWHMAGLSGFSAGLVALWHARRTGEGQLVDVSLQEVAAGVLECAVTPLQMHGRVRGRMGTHHPAVHGVGLQRLGDGHWLFVGTLPQLRMWETVRELMGDPEWAQDERWNDAGVRRAHADEIDALAAPIFGEMETADIYPQMKAGRVPVGLVRDMTDLHDPEGQLAARDFFTAAPDGALHPGAPWRMEASPWALRLAAPLLDPTSQPPPTRSNT